MQSLEPLTVKMQFDALCQARPELRGFVDPCALLDHLHDLSGDRDEKDRVLAGLVTVSQGAGPGREVAVILLWLALWPGLDVLYRRLWRHFAAAPDDLVSEISERFTAAIHRLDRGRVRRIAATLLLNVERDIRADLRKRWAEAARRDEMPDDGAENDSAAGTVPPTARPDSVFGLPPGVDADTAAARIRETLATMIGDDADGRRRDRRRGAMRSRQPPRDQPRRRAQTLPTLDKPPPPDHGAKVMAACPNSMRQDAFPDRACRIGCRGSAQEPVR